MPRVQRNVVGNWVDQAARLPWWGGFVLAFLAFIMLHPFAIMEVAAAGPVDDYSAITSKAFWRGIADTVQYIVPGALIFAPLVAAAVNRILKGPGA